VTEANTGFVALRRTLPLMAGISALFDAQMWMFSPLAALYVLHLDYSLAWLGAIISAQGAFRSFLVAQLSSGLSRAIYNPAADSYASRIDEANRAKTIGRYRSGAAIGGVTGPLIGGGVVALTDFTTGFLTIAAVQLVAFLMTFALPTLPRGATRSLRAAVAPLPSIARSKPVFLACIWTLGISVSPALFLAVLLPLYREAEIAPFQIGVLLSSFFVASSITAFSFERVHRRIAPPTIYTIAAGGLAIVFFLTSGASTLPQFLILMALNGAAMALGNNLRLVLTAEYSKPEHRGVASSYVGSYWALGAFLGPLALGVIASAIGLQSTIVVAAAFAGGFSLSAALLFRVLGPSQTPDIQPATGT
jgi:predicted MFS family arabinose efflux permease